MEIRTDSNLPATEIVDDAVIERSWPLVDEIRDRVRALVVSRAICPSDRCVHLCRGFRKRANERERERRRNRMYRKSLLRDTEANRVIINGIAIARHLCGFVRREPPASSWRLLPFNYYFPRFVTVPRRSSFNRSTLLFSEFSVRIRAPSRFRSTDLTNKREKHPP